MTDVQTGDNKESSTATDKEVRDKSADTEASTEQPEVVWDDSKMATNFANVVNIQSSLEQLDICFGMNHTWNLGNEPRVRVELSNRVIMSPVAAKRLLNALERVLKEHERRYGELTAV